MISKHKRHEEKKILNDTHIQEYQHTSLKINLSFATNDVF